MKHMIKAAFVATAVSVAAISGAQAQDVKVGVAAEPYPPFTSPDASGNWVGWEVEFMEAICAEAKLNCVITPVAWDGIIPALTSGKIDMIVGSMSITEERLKTIDFSDKYYNTPTSIIGAKGDDFEATRKVCRARSSVFRSPRSMRITRTSTFSDR
jgi:polar amino acid transport system substrate-binding protein